MKVDQIDSFCSSSQYQDLEQIEQSAKQELHDLLNPEITNDPLLHYQNHFDMTAYRQMLEKFLYVQDARHELYKADNK